MIVYVEWNLNLSVRVEYMLSVKYECISRWYVVTNTISIFRTLLAIVSFLKHDVSGADCVSVTRWQGRNIYTQADRSGRNYLDL